MARSVAWKNFHPINAPECFLSVDFFPLSSSGENVCQLSECEWCVCAGEAGLESRRCLVRGKRGEGGALPSRGGCARAAAVVVLVRPSAEEVALARSDAVLWTDRW